MSWAEMLLLELLLQAETVLSTNGLGTKLPAIAAISNTKRSPGCCVFSPLFRLQYGYRSTRVWYSTVRTRHHYHVAHQLWSPEYGIVFAM